MVTAEHIQEMKDLNDSGDLDFDQLRRKYKARTGDDYTFLDDEMAKITATQNDNYGDDDLILRMRAFRMGAPLNEEGPQA